MDICIGEEAAGRLVFEVNSQLNINIHVYLLNSMYKTFTTTVSINIILSNTTTITVFLVLEWWERGEFI